MLGAKSRHQLTHLYFHLTYMYIYILKYCSFRGAVKRNKQTMDFQLGEAKARPKKYKYYVF